MTLTAFDIAQALVIGGLCGSGAILACDTAAALWWRARQRHTEHTSRKENQ